MEMLIYIPINSVSEILNVIFFFHLLFFLQWLRNVKHTHNFQAIYNQASPEFGLYILLTYFLEDGPCFPFPLCAR